MLRGAGVGCCVTRMGEKIVGQLHCIPAFLRESEMENLMSVRKRSQMRMSVGSMKM